jgi:hypothetical protein
MHFSDYRTRPNGSVEYLVQWQSTELTLPQLCENLDGQPLLGQASSLEPHQQASRYLMRGYHGDANMMLFLLLVATNVGDNRAEEGR